MCHEDWAGEPGGPQPEQVGFDVADATIPASLYRPAPGTLVKGACVLVTDIYGPVPFYQEIARRLGAFGYPTALPDLFFREGPLPEVTRDAAFARHAKMDERRAVADIGSVLDQMKGRSGTDRASVVGFCLGGLIGLDLCADRADLAVVSFYGFPEGLPGEIAVPALRPIDLVEKMRGPILAFWGDQDYIVATDVVERFDAKMADYGIDYESKHYPEAGHGFLQGLVEDREDSAFAADAWERTLGFLDSNFASAS